MATIPAPLTLPDGIADQKGYSVLHHSGGVDSRGFAILSSGGAFIPTSMGFAVLIGHAAIPKVGAYAIVANPAVITNSMLYSVAANSSGVLSMPGYVILSPFYPPYSDIPLFFDFAEERFPECVSFGSSGGPGFKTSVFEFDSGFTADVIEWDRLRARYSVTFENATPTDIEGIEEFFYGMRGRAIGFRYKDWSDYQISAQNVFVGDGSTTVFQIFKRYTSGGHVFDRIIRKPVTLTLDLKLDGAQLLDGSDYFLNTTTGSIVFPSTAPAAGAIGTITYMEFDVPVRFDTDRLDVAYNDFRQLGINSLPMIEVLV